MEKVINILSKSSSIFTQIMSELRDMDIQTDRMRFRFNLERAGELMAYEISRHLEYENRTVTTPLGSADVPVLKDQPVIVGILRAGLPLHQGFLRIFDHADNGFISAYRQHTNENEFVIKVEYMACPDLEGRTLILVDPMIATGKSLYLSYQSLLSLGTPKEVFVAGVIGSEEGVQYLRLHMPNAKIFVGDVDKELTAKSYIVPGLGDAGDLAYGAK
jgi:uracil phosphoribosyltransferase